MSDEIIKEEMENQSIPKTMMSVYDPNSGMTTIDESIDCEKVAEDNWKVLTDGNEQLDEDILAKLFEDKDLQDIQDVSTLSSVIKRRMNGEKFPMYEALPQFLKNEVNKVMLQTAGMAKNNKQQLSINKVSEMFIDTIIDEYKASKEFQFDLDSLLTGFDKDIEEANREMSSELGDMMLSLDEERKIELEKAIGRCKEEGKIESIEKLEAIRDTIDSAFNLNEFAEACKSIKIKKYELEKPQKVFNGFNYKYEKHKNTINDISTCPIILNNHLKEYTTKQNILLCIAFCKYCMNMSPDNMEEHTFMYYFIRNIITLDRVNPKGMCYDIMDDKQKKFYDDFIISLDKCLKNIILRNQNL